MSKTEKEVIWNLKFWITSQHSASQHHLYWLIFSFQSFRSDTETPRLEPLPQWTGPCPGTLVVIPRTKTHLPLCPWGLLYLPFHCGDCWEWPSNMDLWNVSVKWILNKGGIHYHIYSLLSFTLFRYSKYINLFHWT